MISEAKKNGVYLILSLVNNWDDYGGKKQYNQWAREHGQYISNDDDFYTNPLVKEYYKNHIKVNLYHFLLQINSLISKVHIEFMHYCWLL